MATTTAINHSNDGNWQPGQTLELTITGLSHTGEGLGRLDNRVIFVPDSVTGDRLTVRLTHVKPSYAQGQIQAILEPSSHRVRPACIVADKCGGCQWQHITPAFQADSKQQQIIDALERIGGFISLPIQPLLASPHTLGYRNKVTYPLARSSTGQVQAGYYRRQSHRLINLNQCPVQDSRLNPLLKEIKEDIQLQGWSIYDETQKRGKLRHLSFRIGRRTGEILLTLISAQASLTNLKEQAEVWLGRYPDLVGVALNLQPQPNNLIFGPETRVIAGQGTCREHFAGLTFDLGADTFFQINTEAAELLLEQILPALALSGEETLVDAYCGVGTFTLPLARRVKQAIGLEVNPNSVRQAEHNAEANQITNTIFGVGNVEEQLAHWLPEADLVWLDPPRKGCHPSVLAALLAQRPKTIVYQSCQPATLARDLKILCGPGAYQLTWVQGADFFPQTSHVECAVILQAT
ncbi:23S rRNA (uracil(1939)-C(5))-methyltransferase RlmD [Synechocystis sp. LKSZ1]|uniref:23S rRNA (uracil(1939)-C(5))-methyltransferase RlmD n=1 Tax=Synechocystis sp. LKSZ1 TaxID=3144951 RepID=UPI00336C204B